MSTLKIAGKSLEEFQERYDKLLKRGLSCGLSDGNQVCIEAAVFCAMEKDGDVDALIANRQVQDSPKCVDEEVASIKIALNDATWRSEKARARGLYRVGIAQLGTRNLRGIRQFRTLLAKEVEKVIGTPLQMALKQEKLQKKVKTLDDFFRLPYDTREDLITAAGNFDVSTHDDYDNGFEGLSDADKVKVAKAIEKVLRKLKAPGVKWLDIILRQQKGRKRGRRR